MIYRPIRDYGGWGIRYGLKRTAYNAKGNRDVFFEFWEGSKVKKLMIGSQTQKKFSDVVSRAINKQKPG
ncbi:hypothetical protein [Methanosarcina acetivorans]|uniref:Uncharacterized protein n=1 Tax=Methanosarcina acetivorans (strain ATCC 35395 / DSM 2834 / JCM 12185 / C2A) TaxID=188937 RepID=Q8TP58_METAC|nr:hypothetical protein [Methanosarcina acetivorans]AAM05462.1 predicted protein [Methanosarcina acetivorans C2A]